MVISRTMRSRADSTRSTAPMSPPASPMAIATRPSMPGLLVIDRRTVTLYEALGVTATTIGLWLSGNRGMGDRRSYKTCSNDGSAARSPRDLPERGHDNRRKPERIDEPEFPTVRAWLTRP